MASEPLRPDDPAAIGGYELLGRLGQGGQGVVYLARWPGSSGGPVALKTPHGGTADLSEITLVRQVARFCTARVLDAGTDGDRPYIVSEYVDGLSLRSAVEDGGPLSGVELERLAVGTMVALAATHAADVVHRDFTPGNVLLAADGPRVVDFGVARALGPSGRGAPGASGTPAFMAPEQAAGGEVGAAADVFSWAVTMAYAALGPGVLDEDGPGSAFGRLLRLERCVADLPGWLAEIVAPCLAEDPGSRPEARDVLDRLLGYGGRPAGPSEGGTTRRDPGPAPEGAHPRAPTIGRRGAEPSDRARRHPGPAAGRTVISAWRRHRVLIVGTALALAGALAVVGVAASWPERRHHAPAPAHAPVTASARPLTVGSANFPESVLLGEIYAQALEARGRKVVRKRAIGSREAYFPLVRGGEVDVVPEYNGALASYLGAVDLGARTPATTRSVNAALHRKLPRGLRVLGSSKAEDKDAIVVTRRTARVYGLSSLAALAGAAGEFVLGGTPEAQTRRQGMIGLRAVYGAGFKGFQPFRQEDFGTMADLLDRGSLQAAQMFTTDPLLRSHGFTVLSDPEHLFGAQNVTPLIADAQVDAAARAALDAVSAKLTTEDLRYMNGRIALEKDEVDDVAKAWLVQNGLLRSG